MTRPPTLRTTRERHADAGFAFAHADRPTFAGTGAAKLLDYVFHTAGLSSRPMDPPPISYATKLPSPDQPSDRLALIAHFGWLER